MRLTVNMNLLLTKLSSLKKSRLFVIPERGFNGRYAGNITIHLGFNVVLLP